MGSSGFRRPFSLLKKIVKRTCLNQIKMFKLCQTRFNALRSSVCVNFKSRLNIVQAAFAWVDYGWSIEKVSAAVGWEAGRSD